MAEAVVAALDAHTPLAAFRAHPGVVDGVADFRTTAPSPRAQGQSISVPRAQGGARLAVELSERGRFDLSAAKPKGDEADETERAVDEAPAHGDATDLTHDQGEGNNVLLDRLGIVAGAPERAGPQLRYAGARSSDW